jgi:hypothetical protein
MEHVWKVAEALLAVAGAGRFCHEVVELAHHIMKMKFVVKLLK